jgi:hypothetical protein
MVTASTVDRRAQRVRNPVEDQVVIAIVQAIPARPFPEVRRRGEDRRLAAAKA